MIGRSRPVPDGCTKELDAQSSSGGEMSKAPIVFKSTHRIRFSELDPYDHVSTGNYATSIEAS
jgi:hypothetical protein